MPNKFHHELTKALKKEGVAVELVGKKGHFHFSVTHPDGRVQRLTTSASPTNPDHTIRNAVRDVRRFAAGLWT